MKTTETKTSFAADLALASLAAFGTMAGTFGLLLFVGCGAGAAVTFGMLAGAAVFVMDSISNDD